MSEIFLRMVRRALEVGVSLHKYDRLIIVLVRIDGCVCGVYC